MRAVDRAAIDGLGIPALALMENAGRATADAAAAMCPPGSLVAVVAGKGNNGGDGCVAARHLHGRGYGIEVWLAAGEPVGDAAVEVAVLRRIGLRVEPAPADLVARLRAADLVLDACLGTGASGPVQGPLADAIGAINACGRPVLAVDCPSGLDCTTGETLRACANALRANGAERVCAVVVAKAT